MTWNVRKLISPPFQRISITNRVLSLFDCFTTYYNCMTWIFKKTHISDISVHKVSQVVFLAYLTVLRLITTLYDLTCQKTHISPISVHKYHKSCFSLIWPFYMAYYNIMTWNFQKTHYLRYFSAQVSQIVFLAYLTVLRLITTVWPNLSENSYLHHFSAQVSQIVFFAYLTVLQLITTLWPEMSENSYLSDFSAQVSQIVFLAYLTVLRLITTVWPEMSENSYLRHFSAQVSQIVFFAYFTL